MICQHKWESYPVDWDVWGFMCDQCDEELVCPECGAKLFTISDREMPDDQPDEHYWCCWRKYHNVTHLIDPEETDGTPT